MGYSRDEWCVPLFPRRPTDIDAVCAHLLVRVAVVALRIELASSAGFPSLLDPSSGYTGGGGSLLDPSSGYTGGGGSKHGFALPPPMNAKPGWHTGTAFSQPSRSAYTTAPLGPKPAGGRSPRRGPRTAPRGGRSQWDRPLARSWDRPLARSRMYKSIDSTSSGGGGGGGRSSTMHHSGPFDYHPPLGRPALATPGQKRPDTSPAHLALESQVEDALKELTGVMEEGVKMFDVPPSTPGGPREGLSSEENTALVSRLKDQIRSTDALVKKLYARNASLEQRLEEMEAQAEQREDEEANAGGGEELAQLRLLAAEKERFIEELQTQLVATVQGKEAEAAAQADRAAAELRAVRFFHTYVTLCTLILAYSSRTVLLE